LFLHLCRLLQNQATIDLVRAILTSGNEINLPLSLRLPALSGEPARQARDTFAEWWNIENLVAALNGDHERRAEVAEAYVGAVKDFRGDPTAPPPHTLWDLRTTFVWAQRQLVQYIRLFNKLGFKTVPDTPIFPDGVDDRAIDAEMASPPTADDLAIDRFQLGFDLFFTPALPWDVNGIIESAAKAAEFFQSDVTYERLAAWLAQPVSQDRAVYRVCLENALQSIHTQEVGPFLLSYMTICELVLFAPLLP